MLLDDSYDFTYNHEWKLCYHTKYITIDSPLCLMRNLLNIQKIKKQESKCHSSIFDKRNLVIFRQVKSRNQNVTQTTRQVNLSFRKYPDNETIIDKT